ncbi:menaquinone reductase integral membrane subunit QrcD [Desulfonatronum lacustre]|uniref:menaquinone reductase integral membrane subunit QrcD n=1 Tax=Desulfonatronum lacustre TaxID=66849 RepID=UPI0004902C78|nr:menaquinone reductase integral membrane subunit QrcD [Desulfonatronum lacustre]SMP68612.1 prokaryotic molybdopterin-containing oxidoreductase family, membrane subunit [Desulfonatronum zhilinae]
MSDKELWPEGVQRCSLKLFIAWLAVIFAVLAWGVYAAYVVWSGGLIVTGMDNYFAFGLYIIFDLAVIALGAGAFFSGLLYYLIRVEGLKNIINLAVIIGFICYSGALLILTLEVGQPLRAWFGFWHPNVHSMLTEVIFCITVYMLVLTIEFIPIILENRKLNKIKFLHHMAHNFHVIMPLFAGVGAFLSFFHQGSLGGMYGVLFSRPYAFREGFFIWPWTFFLFILSAVASGPGFTMLVATLMEKMTGRKLVDFSVKALMGKISGTMLAIYLVFKYLDTWAWATGILPRSGLTFSEVFYGVAYGKWLLFSELIVCGLFPAILLLNAKTRNTPWILYSACTLVGIGVIINRYVQTAQTLAHPVMPFDRWYVYMPTWAEWAPSLAIIAYGALILSLAYRYLPVFPQERKLNQA